jgi:hypothetical protein
MGSVQIKEEPPKICLVPPLIRKRRPRPICANEVCLRLSYSFSIVLFFSFMQIASFRGDS